MKRRTCSAILVIVIFMTYLMPMAHGEEQKQEQGQLMIGEGQGTELYTAEETYEDGQEVLRELETLQESSTEKYIIKRKAESSEINTALQEAFTYAKNAKIDKTEKILAKSGYTLEEVLNIDKESIPIMQEMNKSIEAIYDKKPNALLSESNNFEEIQIKDLSEDKQAITMSEKVEPEAFVQKLQEQLGDEIEYVQPDYELNLSMESQPDTTIEIELVDNELVDNYIEETDNNILDSTQEENEDNNELDLIQEENDAILDLNQEETEVNVTADLGTENLDNTGEDIIVAVIDTGIDTSHPDLTDHITGGYDFVNDSAEVYNPNLGMEQAHGTHIAGIIAKTASNATILPLKVFENGTAYTSDIIEAINYAKENGASIVNCSWGCTEENFALKETMENSDMTFVCAVGNNRLNLSETPIYPACYDLDNIISVTSVNNDGGLSYFSNYGDVDIAAPGRDIESAFPENQTGKLSGTSVSAAFVSGALGLCNDKYRVLESSDMLANLQDVIFQGRRLNIDNLANGIEPTEIINVDYVEDFNAEGYVRTPADNWSLFGELSNVSVVAGNEFVAVLKENGTVWTWGKNNNGQLGVGNYVNSTEPQQIPNLNNIVEIAAGLDYMMARDNNGQVFAWGNNQFGALGNGTTTRSNTPVTMLNGDNAVYIAAGNYMSYVIKSGGDLYVCGDNRWGQLGDGTNTKKVVLQKVDIDEPIAKVEGDNGASFAITESGRVYSWGDNTYGRLGDGTTADARYTPEIAIDSGIVDLSMGFFDVIALGDNGNVYQWGYGYWGVPIITMTDTNVKKVVSGRQAWFVLSGTTIKSKGNNEKGSLGVGSTGNKSSWTNVSGSFDDFDITEYMGIAIGSDGFVYTWGLSDVDEGQYNTSPLKVDSDVNELNPGFNSQAEKEFMGQANDYINVFIKVNNMQNIDEKIFKIEYPEQQMNLIDTCGFTKKNELTAGEIQGLDIKIVSVSPGVVQFKTTNHISEGKVLSGVINLIKFKALTDGSKTVRCTVLNDIN